jgi:electron transport complex protein RnfG
MYGKGVLNPSYRQRTMHHAMLLGGMAAITSALLAIGNKQTYPDIELRHMEDMKRSISQVIPPDLHTNDLLKDVLHFKTHGETKDIYLAKSDGKVKAVAFRTTTQGYGGAIDLIIGIKRNGDITGTRILSHNETPGLGDKIEAKKDHWIFAFTGLSLKNPGESQWKVKKDGGYFDQFTGATITPRAVVKAVKTSLVFFRNNENKILAGPGTQDGKTLPQKKDMPATKTDLESRKQSETTSTPKGTTNG